MQLWTTLQNFRGLKHHQIKAKCQASENKLTCPDKRCFVSLIVIDPIPEYFNDNISPCDSNACLTYNSLISDQLFKSNLTGRIYKTQTYEQLTCGSPNVVYDIHCI